MSIILVKFDFLSHKDCLNAPTASTVVSTLWTHIAKFESLEFSPLQNIYISYASQTSVPSDKVDIFMVCAILYKLDLPSIIIYTGSNCTSSHQYIDAIIATLTLFGYDDVLVRKIKITMSVGYPSYINTHSSQEGFKVFTKYGN